MWRRSFDIPPPPMEEDHKYYDSIVHHPVFEVEGPSKEEFPMYESLKLTMERTLPYWNNNIVPDLRAGKRVLIVAHGNSLRGIIKHVDREFFYFNTTPFLNWLFALKFIIQFRSD